MLQITSIKKKSIMWLMIQRRENEPAKERILIRYLYKFLLNTNDRIFITLICNILKRIIIKIIIITTNHKPKVLWIFRQPAVKSCGFHQIFYIPPWKTVLSCWKLDKKRNKKNKTSWMFAITSRDNKSRGGWVVVLKSESGSKVMQR